MAHFTLNDAETELTYRIELSGLDLKQNPVDRTAPNDVTKVHIHWGDRGTNGPHVLNVFGLPGEDDSGLTVDFDTEVIVGTWDDSDVVGIASAGRERNEAVD